MRKTKHSKHQIRFHLVFIPKYRKDLLQGVYKTLVEDLIVYKIARMGGKVHEFSVQSDHVHIFFEISPAVMISAFVGQLKQYITSELFKTFPELRRNLPGAKFWARGYFIGSCGVGDEVLKNYIRTQNKERTFPRTLGDK